MLDTMTGSYVILFDGVCNFCNGAVNFVIKHDRKSHIKFAPLQSDAGQQLLHQHSLSGTSFDTFFFIEKGKVFKQSTAALKVCKYLGGLWPLAYGLIIVPPIIRDGIYNWIAKNRYRWFGKKAQCMIPTPEVRQRFL